jgi:hypothetical protein
MCGGDLEIEEGMTVCECEYCGTKQTVPNVDDDKKRKLFERANKLRANCEFDKAAGVYENIVSEYSEEAEGYWGLILCRYGIEYVDDPNTGKKIPTCHRSSFDSIMDDEDFDMVMENSDSVSRAVYREEAKYIEEIRKGIIEVSGKEKPYDIFICYKETNEDGERTLDSVLAQDVYDELINKGYRVFFSRITLEDKLGVEYEPYIFAALNSAKIMLVFGTSYDFFNAVWVKNEWSRYLKLMAKDKSKHLIPCFKNVDAYDIPKEFAKLQSQDMGKIGANQDLIRGIEKLLSPELKVEKPTSAENIVINNGGVNGNSLLKRGIMAIEDGEWSKAVDFFEQVLNINAEDCHAYWGELLASYQCKDSDELGNVLYSELIKELSVESVRADVPDRYSEFKEKYFFMDIFTEDDIKRLFYTPFAYESKLPSLERIAQYNRDNFVLDSNKLYQKAIRYSDENIQTEIGKTKNKIESNFELMKEKIKEEESGSVNNIINMSDSYYEKLESALKVANELARTNADKNEAEFMANHEQWVYERDNFAQTIDEWNRDVEKYKNDYQVWLSKNSELLNQYDLEKKKYAKEKKKYEDDIIRLNDEILLVGDRKRDDRKKTEMRNEILTIRNQLKNLSVPQEPILSPVPIEPSKPILRTEPIMSFEEKIGNDEVMRVFNECME